MRSRIIYFCTIFVQVALGVYNENPCSSNICQCFDQNAGSCSGEIKSKFGDKWSCPTQPDNIVCCCGSVGGGGDGSATGVRNEAPCSSNGCHCFDRNSGSCSGEVKSKIGDQDSCPTQPDNIVCCCPSSPSGSGVRNEAPCSSNGCHCFDQNAGSCSGEVKSKIGSQDSCPTQPDSIVCCCLNSSPKKGSSVPNEAPCSSNGCHCFDRDKESCSGEIKSKIGAQDSCPTQPDNIVCCCGSSSTVTGHDEGSSILEIARKQIGLPYIWGGGGKNGPTGGGFDCSGLTQYAVYRATGKSIARVAQGQYDDGTCARIPFGSRRNGDLIFWGKNGSGSVYHVGVANGSGRVVYAPEPGQRIKDGPLYGFGDLMPYVRRC